MKKTILFFTAIIIIVSFLHAQTNCDSFITSYGNNHNSSKLFLYGNKYYFIGDYKKDVSSDPSLYITKTDTCGNKNWEKYYVYNTAAYQYLYTRAVDQSSTTGDFFAAISADSSVNTTNNQIRLLKISRSGELLWTATFSNSFDNVPYSVHATADGGALVGGCTGFWFASTNTSLLVKFSKTGAIEWSKTYTSID